MLIKTIILPLKEKKKKKKTQKECVCVCVGEKQPCEWVKSNQ